MRSTSRIHGAAIVSLLLFLLQGVATAQNLPEHDPAESSVTTVVPQKLLLSFLADSATFTLIDARSPEEFAASHIGGAINVPHDSAPETAQALPTDRSEPIVIYCKTGKRAGALQMQLQERGYTDVRILQPDQVSWFDGIAVFNCGVPSQEPTKVLTSNRASGSREESK